MKRAVVASLVLMVISGCGGITPPPGYLKIQPGVNYAERYLSVEGNVIAVRAEPNPKGGTLDYWAQAIQKEMVDVAGYTLVKCDPIKASAGEGRLIEFSANVGDVPHTYWVAVFVNWQRILVVEAGGKADKMAADRAAIVKAIQSAG